MGAAAIYSWWFAMKLVFIAFWNSIHDVQAAEARESARPHERGPVPNVSSDANNSDEQPAAG
jgi:hypothetical protein